MTESNKNIYDSKFDMNFTFKENNGFEMEVRWIDKAEISNLKERIEKVLND